MQKTPVADAIKQELARRLTSQWSPGERLPAVSQLARMLGTGQRNTHRALRELVDDGYLVSRPGQGTFVKHDIDTEEVRALYKSRPVAALQTRGRLQGKRVLLTAARLAPGTHTHMVLEAACEMLEAEGATVDKSQPGLWVGDHDFSEVDVDGVLALTWSLRMSRYILGGNQVGCFVLSGISVRVAMGQRYDVVCSDAEQGGFLAGERMRALGHGRAAFLGRAAIDETGVFEETSAWRLRGFEMGFGRPVDPGHYLLANHYDDSAAAAQFPKYLQMKDRPRAIFAASDDLAIGFIVGAAAHGMTFGKDFHIIGFDGQIRGQSIYGGPLSTVEPPHEEIGRQAAEMLTSRLLNPDLAVRRLSLGCRLIEGATALKEGH
jgi:DNA-binding transcriptional regulator YhcF (GntR family)